MKQGNLNIRCTEDYAVLYWDKPAAAPSGAEYTVSLNGEAIGRTDRTHFTIEGLSYGSAFRVDVVSGSYCIGSATLQFGREKRRIDITAAPYFCKGDGHILNTDNLQRAINDCGADDILYVPAGDFLTGALRLHSDLEIYLAKGAVLQGTTNIHDYSPRIPSRFEGTEMRCYSSLLNAGDMNHKTGPNCRNIIIRGRGTICGGGQELARKIIEDERARIKSFLDDNRELVESCENSDTIPGRVRPRLINLSNCENVWISGITLKNGPSWNVHMIYCDDIQTDHCTFVSEGVWNGDGWDPDSSTNCTLFASEFSTGDDAVAIKSGKNPEGNEINRPCAHIRVFDCRSDCGHGICIVPVDLRRGVVRNRLRCHFFGWLRFCLLRRCIAGMQLGQCRANYPAGLLRPVFAQLHNHVLQGLAIELAHGLARAAVQPLRQCSLCLPQLLHQRAHLLRIARVHFLRGVLPSLPLGAGSIELLQ